MKSSLRIASFRLRLLLLLAERVEEHALRNAKRPDGLELPGADAVVDGPARHAQELGGMVQRNAPADTWLGETFWRVVSRVHVE
jgi:hypothetical protein